MANTTYTIKIQTLSEIMSTEKESSQGEGHYHVSPFCVFVSSLDRNFNHAYPVDTQAYHW